MSAFDYDAAFWRGGNRNETACNGRSSTAAVDNFVGNYQNKRVKRAPMRALHTLLKKYAVKIIYKSIACMYLSRNRAIVA